MCEKTIKTELLLAANRWDKYAKEVEQAAAWDRAQGVDSCTPGNSPGDHKAELARCCARTLRAEVITGKEHCMCHEQPLEICPNGDMGLGEFWKKRD